MTNDLNSEIEDNTKRKRIQKMLSSSSSEETLGPSSLPQPPKIKKTRNINKENIQQYSTSTYDDLPAKQSCDTDTDNSKFFYIYTEFKYLQITSLDP